MPLKVLIVEDSKAARDAIAVAVGVVPGVEVVAVPNSLAALKALNQEQFQLIITDINMPYIHGLDLIRFVKQQSAHRDTPIVVYTSEGRQRDRDRGFALGVAEYLVKPVETAALQKVVRQYLKVA